MAAEGSVAVAVPVVHAVAEAAVEDLAVLARARAGPAAVPERKEAVPPHVIQAVRIDISLREALAVYVGAGVDAPVDQHRRDIDSRAAEIGILPDPGLVAAQVALAAEADAQGRILLLPPGGDEIHQAPELLPGQMHVGVARGTSDGDDGEQTPIPHAKLPEQGMDLLQATDIPFVDAGDYVEVDPGLRGRDADRLYGARKAAGAAAHPVVLRLLSVQTDSQGPQPRPHQPGVHLPIIEKAVGHEAPAHSAAAYAFPDLFEVGAQERFAAGKHDGELPRNLLARNGVQCFQEIFQRHIAPAARQRAVAAAVPACQIAPGGALPEQVVQFVDFGFVFSEQTPKPPLQTEILHKLVCELFLLQFYKDGAPAILDDRIFGGEQCIGILEAELRTGTVHGADQGLKRAVLRGVSAQVPVQIYALDGAGIIGPGENLDAFDGGAVFRRHHFEYDILPVQPVGRTITCLKYEKRRRERRAFKQVSEPFLHG